MNGDSASAGRDNGHRAMRCALFVDFDNVYSGLLRLDADAAASFAKEPARWLERLSLGEDDSGGFARRFLVRACYLNPTVYSEFRPYFMRAGFRVIDCPSLTSQGKSSADINLVLDAVDALNAPTRYEEFVIFSADADFTPLALRCRAEDRRVTVALAGPAAGAYRAVADTVIASDQLAELLTRVDPLAHDEDVQTPIPSADAGVKHDPEVVARRTDSAARTSASPAPKAVMRLVRSAEKPLTGSTVAQAARTADPTLGTTSWDGHGSFFAWLEACVPAAGQSSRPAPGYVWDVDRFSEEDLPGAEPSGLTALQRQVVDVTDTPALSKKEYAAVLSALAADVNTQPFVRTETTKRVRDACQAAGVPVGRSSVNVVIQGLLYSDTPLEAPVTASELAGAWADNVEGLCRGARMEFDKKRLADLRDWVGGGLLTNG